MIDRDELIAKLNDWSGAAMKPYNPLWADAILALEKPADGITLTKDEARIVVHWGSELMRPLRKDEWRVRDILVGEKR